MALARVVVAWAIAAACRPVPASAPSWPDAPFELRDEADRDAKIDEFWSLSSGALRERIRDELADALVRDIEDAATDKRPLDAAELLTVLIGLWQSDPTALANQLARHRTVIDQMRRGFARAGALEPAVLALIVLSELDADHRATHVAELDEILAFADDLAVAENGATAVRAQPITLLHNAVRAFPLPWLVDRYISLLVTRQREVSSLLSRSGGASIELVRAHKDILATSRRIVGALARGHRLAAAERTLAELRGIGIDREVVASVEAIVARPSADRYAALASALRDDDDKAADPSGALAVTLDGLALFPDDPKLLAGAGDDARALGRTLQAIDLYERALVHSAEVDTAVALRLGKMYADRIARLATGGRPRAAHGAWHQAAAFTSSAARAHPSAVWQQTAAIAESALGKGLASIGMVDAGRRALTASLERAPSTDAYEVLSTIDAQVDRYRDAHKWARAGIALLGSTTIGDRYRRAKLLRLAGDAVRRQHGRTVLSREAARYYLDSLAAWASLGQARALPRSVAAERLLDSGRALWWLGDSTRAIDLLAEAVGLDPETPTIATEAVAFLIAVGRYREAVDAFHRGLGDPEFAEVYKVYTSLWVIGEARRRGEPPDRLAIDYLASRRGSLWYELLARAASGTLDYRELAAAATTGPRRGELAFYTAVLRLHPAAASEPARRRLLEQAVQSRTVLDAEYDLARAYLAAP